MNANIFLRYLLICISFLTFTELSNAVTTTPAYCVNQFTLGTAAVQSTTMAYCGDNYISPAMIYYTYVKGM